MRSFGHRSRAGGETRLATTGGHAARLGSRTRGRLSIGLIRSHAFLGGRVSGWASQARGRAAMPYTGSPITATSESPTHGLPSTSSTLEATWARGLALPVRDRPQTHHAGQSRCPEVHGSTTGGRSSTIRQRAPCGEHAARPLLQPEEVLNTVVWLMSDQARWITGVACPSTDAGRDEQALSAAYPATPDTLLMVKRS